LPVIDDVRALVIHALTVSVPLGAEHCERWATQLIVTAPESPHYELEQVVFTYWFYRLSPSGWRLRHVVVRVTVRWPNGNATVFYFDDGWWGGVDHLLTDEDIPFWVYEGW